MQVTTVGLDLAKNIFQVHGIDEDGEVAFNRALRRAQVLAFFERLEPCLVGIEACGTSHHWARELIKLGHNVKLIPPAYVKPYVKRGKSDAVDPAAICEAVTQPTMRFVEVKTPEQQAILSVHRTRDLIVRQRTQSINMLDLPPEAPSFITRVCGFVFHILRRRFGQARRVRSPQIAQVHGALVRVFGCPVMSAV